MITSDCLLFFTGEIDFHFLESHINNSGFEVIYSAEVAEFEQLCQENSYDLIIYNAYEEEEVDPRILKSIKGKKNLYTPILLIGGKEDEEIMNTALRHQFDLLIFPFTPTELVVRLQLAVKRKKSELTFHNRLVEYSILFENFPTGILQTDITGNFIRFNKELKNILSMNDMDFTGINFFQLCHPDDYLIERQILDRMLRKETDTASFEVRLINNDGKTIVSKIRASTVWKDQDTLESFIFAIEKIR
ncbi:MAG TPA: PAS domain-containing protein [Bacteroidetes bacterium]|nr:PAS domain-containing protein [Bacteroidota bacterium]